MYIDREQSYKLPSQGCQQVGRAMSVPPAAVLGGLLIITSFVMSPATRLKNIKNVKGCRDGMPKSMQTR